MRVRDQKFALLFPGQGSQSVGMGKSFYETYPHFVSFYSEMNLVTERDILNLMFNGPVEDLNNTLNTQPALFTHSIVSYEIFKRNYPDWSPDFVAGHSLGQVSASVAAGALTHSDGIKLVDIRAKLMTYAGERDPGGMAAILGLDIPTLENICKLAGRENEIVIVANDNCPGQVVISGHKAAIERACSFAKESGAKRALPLAVSIAAHSPLMSSIQDEWNEAIDSIQFLDPEIPIVANTTAKLLMSAEEVKRDLKIQMQSRVRWTESIHLLTEAGINNYFEVGNGNVLAGLVRRINPEAVILPFGKVEDISNNDFGGLERT